MKVMVTGAEGYIGSLLGPMLLQQGFEVVGLDTGYYREGWLYSDTKQLSLLPAIINKDLRRMSAEDLDGFDAIVHLAELSNDPLGENSPEVTYRINHKGSVHLAELAKQVGIKRFVYTSSCSVYGAGEGVLDETSATNPQTAYATCKTLVERDVGLMADENFSPVFLRNATAYGASPRMRFDIVLNNLAGHAWTAKKIQMTSDGTPWRPLVHVLDICEAIRCALVAPASEVCGEIFNVGHNGDNFRVREIAEIVGETFPGCKVTLGDSSGDNRSYQVSFDKIANNLPGFTCRWDARKGAEQLHELFERIALEKSTFEGRLFTRLKLLKFLIETSQIDADFFWKN